MLDFDRTSNIETLRQAAKILDSEVRRLHQQVSRLATDLAQARGFSAADVEAQLRLLQEQLEEDYQRSRAYGGGSERRPRKKNEEESATPKKPKSRHGPTPRRREVCVSHAAAASGDAHASKRSAHPAFGAVGPNASARRKAQAGCGETASLLALAGCCDHRRDAMAAAWRCGAQNQELVRLGARSAEGDSLQDPRSRSTEAGASVLRDFQGVVLGDGYIVYEVLAKKSGFTLANDWCHARRKFLEAEATHPVDAVVFIDEIGALFGVERELARKTDRLSPLEASALRAQVRDEQSKPIVNRIGERAMQIKAMRDSPLAKAIRYIENRWAGLTRFLKDGRIPITSNPVESVLRHPVLGRNNHFGSRSKQGAQVAALYYSLIESAKVNDLNPTTYLREAARARVRGQTAPLPHELAGKSRALAEHVP